MFKDYFDKCTTNVHIPLNSRNTFSENIFTIKRAIRYNAIWTLQVHVSRRRASYLSREGYPS